MKDNTQSNNWPFIWPLVLWSAAISSHIITLQVIHCKYLIMKCFFLMLFGLLVKSWGFIYAGDVQFSMIILKKGW